MSSRYVVKTEKKEEKKPKQKESKKGESKSATKKMTKREIRMLSRSVLRDMISNPTTTEAKKTDAQSLVRILKKNRLATSLRNANQSSNPSYLTSNQTGQSLKTSLQMSPAVVMDPATMFEMSIVSPGVYDSPFVDESHICPAPHGTIVGNAGRSVQNNYYAIIFLSPALASSVSESLALQRSGASLANYHPEAVFELDDLTGGNATWVVDFGNTTSAKKIFAWSGRAEVSLIIPEAVVQGIVYHGNAPASTVLGITPIDLIRMSTEARGEKGGETYVIKSSIVERGSAHQPYGTYSETNLPQDERVSWLIFSPNSAGSLSGDVPDFYSINYLLHYNYFWVPTYQPQVISSVEPGIKAESKKVITAKQRSNMSNCIQAQSTTETIGPNVRVGLEAVRDVVKSAAHAVFSGGDHRKKEKYSIRTIADYGIDKTIDRLNEINEMINPMESMGSSNFAAYPKVPCYASVSADMDYVLSAIATRWGYFADYPNLISEAMAAFELSANNLKIACHDTDAIFKEYKADLAAGSKTVRTRGGRSEFVFTTESGLTLDDYMARAQLLGHQALEAKQKKK